MQQYIGFKLDGSEFTIPILKVREIITTPSITRLPRSEDFMKGIINLRGRIVPVLDLRKLVAGAKGAAGPERSEEAGGKIIVVTGTGGVFGMLVDSITSVINIEESDIESAEGLVHLDRIDGVARFDDRLIIMLDTDKLVEADRMEVIGRDLAGIQRAADMKKIAAGPQAAPPIEAMPAPPKPQPAPKPAPKPAPGPQAAPQAAPASSMSEARVSVKELHDAKEILSRKFSEGDSRRSDSKGKYLEEVLTIIDALAARDFDQADSLISTVVKDAEGELYKRIGVVTRKLHNSLTDFRTSLDPRIRRIADEEVPQAVDSLEYVIKKTEEAANTTLAVVEKYQVGLEDLEMRVMNMATPDPELTRYLDRFRNALRRDLNEIMHAQEFQDITGQTIRRVIDLVNAIEAELIGLIATFGVKPEESKEAAAKPTSEKMTQGDIEDLLSEFGF